MNDPRVAALQRVALAAWLALAGLQLVWHGIIAPPATLPRLAIVLLAVVPLALPLLAIRRVARALLIASIVALAYFCHGVMESWAAPQVRGLALVEVALSLALIVATGTVGLLGRRAARRAA